jgi:hypothetical protein
MKKCRSITYTYDFKSTYRRYVGQKITLTSNEGEAKEVHVSEIMEVPNDKRGFPTYNVYLSNGTESTLWRPITCMNAEPEYYANELL